MKRFFTIALCCVAVSALVSCQKVSPDQTGGSRSYQNLFAYTYMNQVYVWTDDIRAQLDSWKSSFQSDASKVDPIETVDRIKYKYDKWSFVTDEISKFQNSVAGIETTFGFRVRFYIGREGTVAAVILCTYKDSPAEKAGLNRGDYIVAVNGVLLTRDNYKSMYYDYFDGGVSCSFSVCDQLTREVRNINMTPVKMYEEPVMLSKVFDVAGKKVGYLLYDSFTQKSVSDLKIAAKQFANAGVTELILDMRYNGGGYVPTELALATILAPKSVIGNADGSGGAVYQRLVFNSRYDDIYDEEDRVYRFSQLLWDSGGECYNVSGCNLDLKKLYAILTPSSASASEAVLVGLLPYMDVEIIGEPKTDGTQGCSSGKYCQGLLCDAESFLEANRNIFGNEYDAAHKALNDWGIYVMNARYTDCNGDCPIMPDGFIPDVKSEDDPFDGAALGDPEETMLAAALSLASGIPATRSSKIYANPEKGHSFAPADFQPSRPSVLVSSRGQTLSSRGLTP